jgi:hypothetical protein
MIDFRIGSCIAVVCGGFDGGIRGWLPLRGHLVMPVGNVFGVEQSTVIRFIARAPFFDVMIYRALGQARAQLSLGMEGVRFLVVKIDASWMR